MMVVVRRPRTSEVEPGGCRTEGHPQQLSMLRASLGSMRAYQHCSGLVWYGLAASSEALLFVMSTAYPQTDV